MPVLRTMSEVTVTPWKSAMQSASSTYPAHPASTTTLASFPRVLQSKPTLRKNIVRILAEADMGVEDIVKLTQHLIRRDDLTVYRDIRTRYLGTCAPASMLTFLPELVWPDMLIELEVVAAQ